MVLLAVPVIVLAFVMVCGERHETVYTAVNRAILDSLPIYPGATIESQQDNYYHLTEPDGPSGWTTGVTYRVGSDVTDEQVIQFYMDGMDGWQSCRTDIGIIGALPGGATPPPAGATPGPLLGSILQANFIRGQAQVSLTTDGLNSDGRNDTFQIGIDQNAYRNFCTGEILRSD